MKRIPKTRMSRISVRQRQALKRWLNEWRIDQLLRTDDPIFIPKNPTAAKPYISLYDRKSIEVGQIRLFHPFSVATSGHLRYIVVLKRNNDESWLVAPFSRFCEPAVQGEYTTGKTAPALRTLCLWNARILPNLLIVRSWVVDRMTASRIAQAITIHDLLADDKPLPSPLVRRVGPPLVHPLDPRYDYIEEEREWLSALQEKCSSDNHANFPYATGNDIRRSLPLAAEKRAEYRPSKRQTKTQPGTDAEDQQ